MAGTTQTLSLLERLNSLRGETHQCSATVRRLCPKTLKLIEVIPYDYSQSHVRLKGGRKPYGWSEPTARQKIAAVTATVAGLRQVERGTGRMEIEPWTVLGCGRTDYFRKHGGNLTVLKKILKLASETNVQVDPHQLSLKSLEISRGFTVADVHPGIWAKLPEGVVQHAR